MAAHSAGVAQTRLMLALDPDHHFFANLALRVVGLRLRRFRGWSLRILDLGKTRRATKSSRRNESQIPIHDKPPAAIGAE